VQLTLTGSIERYSHVMHIVSGVQRARSPPGRDAFDLFAAAFPGGTLGRCAEGAGDGDHRASSSPCDAGLLRRYRTDTSVRRGDMDHAITIRTLDLPRRRLPAYQAGAGIVADSVPKLERRGSARRE
jgi:anthranilate/para-aminobenzoate synthase component I